MAQSAGLGAGVQGGAQGVGRSQGERGAGGPLGRALADAAAARRAAARWPAPLQARPMCARSGRLLAGGRAAAGARQLTAGVVQRIVYVAALAAAAGDGVLPFKLPAAGAAYP